MMAKLRSRRRGTLDWWKCYLDSCASYHTFFVREFLKDVEEDVVLELVEIVLEHRLSKPLVGVEVFENSVVDFLLVDVVLESHIIIVEGNSTCKDHSKIIRVLNRPDHQFPIEDDRRVDAGSSRSRVVVVRRS